ncbi:hypothetical protein QBC44DRAFT_324444 [Cladorrhinum sp. PSN332]|nr:hypothetical protein QBC44DRAFT_324444 [Cladorrhinum sp. PSN332]
MNSDMASSPDWWLTPETSDLFPPGRSGRGTKGPRPLTIICTRILADNFHHVKAEDLAELPNHAANRLAKELSSRQSLHGLPFQAWKILMKLHQTNRREMMIEGRRHEFFDTIIDVNIFGTSDLGLYTRPLISHHLDFLVDLTIRPLSVFPRTAHQLLSLAELPNLASLVLDDCPDDSPGDANPPSPAISDRLVRGWSEKSQPFPLLVSISLTAHPGEVTRQALKYALVFPSLQEFDMVKGLSPPQDGEDETVRSWGWDPRVVNSLSDYVPLVKQDFEFQSDGHERPRADISLLGGRSRLSKLRAQTFYRRPWEKKPKRKRDGDGDPKKDSKPPRKQKPRPSKQQNIGDILSGFSV